MQKIIVRHKTTNALYSTLDGKIYKNLVSEVEGNVAEEIAQKIFAISLDATALINEYPVLETLIKKINLKIEPSQTI